MEKVAKVEIELGSFRGRLAIEMASIDSESHRIAKMKFKLRVFLDRAEMAKIRAFGIRRKLSVIE